MAEPASQTLELVGRELHATLAQARGAIENYVEQPDNAALLERCRDELHQVQGVLRVLEIYGAALLAEEMEHVAAYLIATATERKSQAESLDALMRAMVQLPGYLDRVLAGGRDLALVLLPLLNDLRAVRGSPLLSEGTLLLLNLKSDKQAAPVPATPGEPAQSIEQWARKLRARYQLGLIGWIRGERIDANLEIIGTVAQRLEQVATRQAVFQLWWVIGAVIEALKENGLEGGVSVKRLLGLADRELRRLYEQGEARYAQNPPVELLNNLLYYVGRAESSGPRVSAVRTSFRLTELLPVDESIEQERENLSAPSVKLMQTVAAAIREDLSKVKDVLDIFVRRGAAQPQELAPQLELLRKIGDTLGVLGLGELRSVVQAETERLDKVVKGSLRADEGTLVEIAAALIGVEDRLDAGLVGMILPRGAAGAGAGQGEAEGEAEGTSAGADAEFQQVQSAVLRECILNLARVKEAVTQSVGGTLDAAGLDSWPDLMRGLKAGLLMLGKSRAVEVIEGLTTQLKRIMRPGMTLPPGGYLDRLADAIVSVEYYMETLQAGRSDPFYMLDNAETCLRALEQHGSPVPEVSAPQALQPTPAGYEPTVQLTPLARERGAEARTTVALTQSGLAARTQVLPDSAAAQAAAAQAAPTEVLTGAALHAAPTEVLTSPMPGALAPVASRGTAAPQETDPELVRLFIEEAHEELVRIQRHFPVWDQNPLERDALVTVRRAYHTLKGSGRMVGARNLGEFAWAIENLLNRVLDNTLTRTPAILEVLRDAAAALPELIAQLEDGRTPSRDVAGIGARASALAAGRPSTAPVPARPSAPAPGAAAPVSTAAASASASSSSPEAEALAQLARAAREDTADAVAATFAEQTPLLKGAEAAQPAATPAEYDRDRTAPHAALPAAAPGAAEVLDTGSAASGPLDFELTDLDAAAPAPAAAAMAPSSPSAETHGGASGTSDEVLKDIYARETSAHAATVRRWIERERNAPEPHRLPEEVYRACHTLSGSSKMAQARHGIRLAEPLDHWLRRAFSSGAGLAGADLALLADCMQAMEAVATHLDEATGYFVNHWQLRERISAAEQDLERRIAADAAGAPLAATPPTAPAAAAVAGGPQDEDDAAADLGYDPEVAGIFTEEATELIEVSEQALNACREDPASAELRGALKRPLHTLKGGARMAGIVPMGDLSHELESLVMQIDTGRVQPDGDVLDLMQASLDELARMRELVAGGARVTPARALIGRIRALTAPSEGTTAAADAPAITPVAATPVAATPVAATPVTAAPPAAPPAPPPAAQMPPSVTSPEPSPAVAPSAADVEFTATVSDLAPQADLAPHAPSEHEPAIEIEFAAEPESAPAAEASALQAPAPEAQPAATPETEATRTVSIDFGRLSEARSAPEESLLPPQPVPPGREPVGHAERAEMARVDADLLDKLLNMSGEASIARARLEQQLGSIDFNLSELTRTVTRLKEQLRSLEIETEAQILHKHEEEGGHRSEFDPLELDRYSSIQQYSRALAETANDVASIQQLLESLTKDTQNLLGQQARLITELQNGLMRTRMVPFQRHVQRLARIVRQAAADTGRKAELLVEGASGELDRQVLERMLPPFEHMLRNAVVHGIEKPEERVARGKPETGRIVFELHREGAEVMVRLADDGRGMDLQAIRDKGTKLGLIAPGQAVSDEQAMQLILEPGFSTAGTVTQQAGRGVGMDVVATEIKRLGGALHMATRTGEGTTFTIRLPFTLAISHALVVRTGEEFYALPLPTVEGVLRLSKAEVIAHLGRDAAAFDYGGQKYRFQHLASFVGLEPSPLPEQDVTIPVVLVRAGEHSTGLVADELVGSREIVVKSVGPQISSIRGISGATILGDGRIVIILDIGELVRAEWRARTPVAPLSRDRADKRIFAMVVDDSITVRRVTQRLLERNGMRVLTARDGMDAVTLLQEHVPDIILLDIEMPRMDGYEVAAQVRSDARLKDVPIIMITSRVGEKHRARAIELGVDDYLGKPYQEAQLLDAIAPLVERHRAGGRARAGGTG